MGKEWVITTVLNHLHLFFLNFILELPALLIILFLQRKIASELSLRTIGRQNLLAFGDVSDPLVFFL